MTPDSRTQRVVAVGRGAEPSLEPARVPGPEHRRLNPFIGKWITVGATVAGGGAPALEIRASDVYEWVPGGFFVLHAAYGRIGEVDVGGTEIIGYDRESETYQSKFFDSNGNITASELTVREGVWRWQGKTTRATGEFSDDGKTMTAHHERTDDGVNWVPSMEVTLTRVE